MLEKNFGKALKAAGYTSTIAAGPLFFDPAHPGKDVLKGLFDPTKLFDGTIPSFQARYGFSSVTEKGPLTGGDGSSVQTIRDAMDRFGFLSGVIDPNYDPYHDPEGEMQTRMDMLIVQGRIPGPNNYPLNLYNDLLVLLAQHQPPEPTKLLLRGGRFVVTADFIDPRDSKSGHGQAVPLTADTTGAFWFFDSSSLELAIKVIDGQPVNGHFWVYYGALTDVEYTITVNDTKTAKTKTYHNPQGTLASRGDVNAFVGP